MALVLKDRVKEVTTSTGTGTITLAGAATGFQSFSAVGNSNTTYYTIADQAGGNWEVGIGTYTASGTTLSRDTVLSSSNGGALVNFPAGAKDVFVTYPSEFSETAQVGDIKFASTPPSGPGTWLETGKYYSKAAYPELASVVGDVPDLGNASTSPQAQLPIPFAVSTVNQYSTATDGTVTIAIDSGNGYLLKTTDGVTWTPVFVPGVTTGALAAIRYLNGNFIAVGLTGNILISSDGTNWVLSGLATGQTLTDVAYGGGVYVAAGASGTIYYSSDLVNWNIPSRLATTSSISRLAYGAGVFVAASQGGIVTSPDGNTWTLQNAPTAPSYNDVVFANGVFVATSATMVVQSSNGTQWYRAGPVLFNGANAAFVQSATNGTVSVAVGSGGAIAVTTDGTNWKQIIVGLASVPTFNSVFYVNSQFVALGQSGAIWRSADGLNWVNLTTTTITNSWQSLAFGNGVYVAGSATTSGFYVSPDLAEWTFVSVASATVNRIIFGNGLFVAATANGVYTSSNGTSWTQRSTLNASDVVYSGTRFVAVSFAATGTAYSDDGITWTAGGSTGSGCTRLCFGNGLFVAARAVLATTVIVTSPDGVTWTGIAPSLISVGSLAYGVIWNGTQFVLAGGRGFYATSTDGVTWTGAYYNGLRDFNDVRVANGKTVGIGDAGIVVLAGGTVEAVLKPSFWGYAVSAIAPVAPSPKVIAYNGSSIYAAAANIGVVMSSSDASTWTNRISGTTFSNNTSMQAAYYLNGLFLVLGANGAIATSPDGVTYTLRSAGGNALSAAAYGAGLYVAVGVSGGVFSSPDGVTWTSRSAGSGSFVDIVYDNGVFVAVGAGGIYSSADGITWTLRNGATTYRTIYANGLFVSVGANGSLVTSLDGLTWTGRNSNTTRSLYSIVWTGSQFVAVGSAGAVITSPDGVTWSARVSGQTSFFFSGLANNGAIVVATTSEANRIYYSLDHGFTWSSRQIAPLTVSPLSVAYLGGKFIAAGNNGIIYSTNGIDWTPSATMLANTAINPVGTNVTYINSTFMCVTGQFVYTSTDGNSWSFIRLPTSRTVYYSLYSGSTYYLFASGGTYYTSSDAVTWTPYMDPSLSAFTSGCVVAGKVIALGTNACVIIAGAARQAVLGNGAWGFAASNPTSNGQMVASNGSGQYVCATGIVPLYSSDGVTWAAAQGVEFANSAPLVKYLNGRYIGFGSGRVMVSSNGINWVETLIQGSTINDVAFGAGLYVAVGPGALVFTSTDGTGWIQIPGSWNAINSCIYAGGLFVGVGIGGSCITSADGITWTTRSAGSTTFRKVAYLNSTFFAIGDSGTIYTSLDGITWFIKNSNVTAQLFDIAWSGTAYVAVGGTGAITYSTDADVWINRSQGNTSGSLNRVIYAGGKFLALFSVAAYGVIFTSTDGINWEATDIQPGSSANMISLDYVGGRYFVGYSNIYLMSSSDAYSWTPASEVQYVPSTILRLQKIGAFYYAMTSNGLFQSSDGITFAAVRSIRNFPVHAIAYSGSKWVAVSGTANAGNTQVQYTSTNGTTWVKASEFYIAAPKTNITPTVPFDIEYASGNFILAQPTARAYGMSECIYTSPDGVTWTGRRFPLGATLSSQAILASDGTDVVVSTSTTNPGIVRSTDGGLTWSSIYKTTVSACVYDSGYWLVAGYIITDLENINTNTTVNNVGSLYISNGYLISLAVGSAFVITKLDTSNSSALNTNINIVRSYAPSNVFMLKPVPVRGVAIMSPTIRSTAYPFLIAENPAYSYDTGTTFCVLGAIGRQGSYIYAGA